jgi:ribosome-associated protein
MDGLSGQDRMTDTSPAAAVKDLPPEVARAVELMFDRKANDVVLMDLRNISTATDFFLIASGTSDTHVASIADHVVDALKQSGTRPLNVEGERGGRWILVDYFTFVVHVFHPAAREFYQLERLWGDAPIHRMQPQAA